jgi:hypothetical protein
MYELYGVEFELDDLARRLCASGSRQQRQATTSAGSKASIYSQSGRLSETSISSLGIRHTQVGRREDGLIATTTTQLFNPTPSHHNGH